MNRLDGQESGSELREALFELDGYLSDTLAPLMVTDSIRLLLNSPPQLVAEAVEAWAAEQYHGESENTSIADYLFHAMKKLHLMGEYNLVEQETLSTYLTDLGALLLAICPEDERGLLAQSFSRLGRSETLHIAKVQILHRKTATDKASRAVRESAAARPTQSPEAMSDSVAQGVRRFSYLLERLEREAGSAGPTPQTSPRPTAAPAGVPTGDAGPMAAVGAGAAQTAAEPSIADQRQLLLSETLAAAARNARTGLELDQFLDRLRRAGHDAKTSDMIRALGTSLPGWVVPAPTAAAAAAGPAAPVKVGSVEAMHRIITLAGDPSEGGRRFNEMVRTAIDQFNEGFLGRAVTMFELADRIIGEKKVDPAVVENMRKTSHELLDTERLRSYSEDPDQHLLLRKVLTFFVALRPPGLLDDLNAEQKRDRRRLLVALVVVHGEAGRAAAYERLESTLVTSYGTDDWFFGRNLVNLLRRIPRPPEVSIEKEIDLLSRLCEIGTPLPLLKEVIANFGLLKHEKAENILAARLKDCEKLMTTAGDVLPYGREETAGLLDRIVGSLIRLGTPGALRPAVEHGVSRQPVYGDTLARLTDLSGVDLSGDPPTVERLVAALREELPIKLFGFVVRKNPQGVANLIEALSGTPAEPVRTVLDEITRDFTEQEFAQKASKVLAGFEKARGPEAGAPSLSGDLDLFGLPNLLQNLSQNEVSGVLTLSDPSGEPIASLTFEGGKLRHCRAGILRGKDAVYQLLERPVAATFAFSARPAGARVTETEAPLLEIVPILLEGTRRYDELRQACVVVGDGVSLTATGQKPTIPPDEPDSTLVRGVWAKAKAGASAAECEAAFMVDSYRIRRMLAHWVEEGSLKPASP
jgi:hypothetical protein